MPGSHFQPHPKPAGNEFPEENEHAVTPIHDGDPPFPFDGPHDMSYHIFRLES